MSEGVDRLLTESECVELLQAAVEPNDSMYFNIGEFVRVHSTLYPNKKKLVVQMEIKVNAEGEPASLGDVTISPLQIYRFITGK